MQGRGSSALGHPRQRTSCCSSEIKLEKVTHSDPINLSNAQAP